MATIPSLTNFGSTPVQQKGNSLQSGILNGLGSAANWVGKELGQAFQSQGSPNIPSYAKPNPIPGLIQPSTPVKSTSVTHPDGTVVTQTHHAPATNTGGSSTSGSSSSPNSSVTPGLYSATTGLTSTGLNPTQVAQGYSTIPGSFDPVTGKPISSQTAQPTTQPNTVQTADAQGNPITQPISRTSAAQQVYANSQMTPEESYYNNMAVTAGQLKNINTLSPFAESQLYGQPGQQLAPDEAAPDLQGRATGTNALASNLGNIYGSAAQQGYANALHQQQLALGGAENVLDATQPIVSQYGQTNYNPLGGGQNAGGAINLTGAPANDISSLTNSVVNGQIDYQTAFSQLSSAYGAAVANQLLPAIQKQNPNFNVNQSIGQGAAQQGVTSSQQTQKSQYQSALQQGQALQSQLTDLISTFGLNPSDINAVNTGLQKIAENTSSPQYKTLQNYVNDVANTYSQILTPPGGSATDTTRSIASSMLDATASGQSLISVMKSLDQAAQAKISNVVTSTPGTGGGSTPSSFAENWF